LGLTDPMTEPIPVKDENSPSPAIDIPQLILELRQGGERERRFAAEDLGWARCRQAVPALVEGLTDESWAVAESCATALVKINTPEVAEGVAAYLAVEDPRLRNLAAEVLGLLGETAVPTLNRLLKSPDHDVRMFAADLLVNRAGKDSGEALIEAMADTDINVAAAAAEALGRLGNPQHVPVLARYLEAEAWMKAAAIRALGYIGGPQVRQLISPFLADDDLLIKLSAIKALTRLTETDILPDLLRMLGQEATDLYGSELISAIHEHLGRLPVAQARSLLGNHLLDPLRDLVRRQDPDIGLKAVAVMGRIGTRQAIAQLLALVPDSSIERRKAIVAAISEAGSTDLTPLREALVQPRTSFQQKCVALECIGRSANRERDEIICTYLNANDEILKRITLDIIPAGYQPIPFTEIRASLKAANPQIRISAARVMGRLQRVEFVDDLIDQLSDPDPEVLEVVDDALLRIGEHQEIPRLTPYLNSFSKSERRIAFQYFGSHQPEKLSRKFIEGLADPSVEIRVIAFKVLGNLKLATFDRIRRGLNDDEESVKIEAVRALKTLPLDRTWLDFVEKTLAPGLSERVRVELVRSLVARPLGDVLPLLLKLLADESSWVRLETVEALKQLGDKRALQPLRRLLMTAEAELAEIVRDAIDQMDHDDGDHAKPVVIPGASTHDQASR